MMFTAWKSIFLYRVTYNNDWPWLFCQIKWLVFVIPMTDLYYVLCSFVVTFWSMCIGTPVFQEIRNMLHMIVKRVEGTEKEVKDLKKQINKPTSDCVVKKMEISSEVRESSLLKLMKHWWLLFVFSLKLEKCTNFGGCRGRFQWQLDQCMFSYSVLPHD